MSKKTDATEGGAQSTAETLAEEVRNIGFYDYVEVDGQFFHVQTEVLPSPTPCIQTTVLRSGTVVESTISAIETRATGALLPERVAQAQHDGALAMVRQGEYCEGAVEHGDN